VNIDPYVASLVAAFAVALAASAALFALVPRLGGRLPLGGLVRRPLPVGGFAVLGAFALAPFIAEALSDKAYEYFRPKQGDFLGFLAAVALVFATGLVDDWRAVRPFQKLAGQIVAAGAVYAAGYRLEAIALPAGDAIHLGLLALPATLLWVVFFTNAFNLIDGKDGVAGGVGVISAVAIAAVAADTHHPAIALLCIGLAGAGLGFLLFNLPPAKLMLGDAGALVFGFILASLSIRGATGVEDSVFVSVPLLAMGFPVLDTLLSASRRLLDHRHPFAGDTDHIHHRIGQIESRPLGILVVLYSLSGLFALAALGTHFVDSLAGEVVIFAALIVLVALVLGRLGYFVTMWNSEGLLALRRRLVRTTGS